MMAGQTAGDHGPADMEAVVEQLESTLAGRTHRSEIGTRHGRRALGCFKQAVLILRWFIDGTRLSQLARDNGLSSTAPSKRSHM
ncbi:hypothetical protein GCM10018966_102880 [Streptomyces yanii]